MAILHLGGTRLAPVKAKAPLNRRFMYAIGFIYLLAMHFYIPNNGQSGLSLPFNIAIWMGLSWVFFIGLRQIVVNRQVRYSKLTIGLLISCLIMSIPFVYSAPVTITGTVNKLTGLWLGWLLFLLLQQFSLSNAHKQRLLWFIVLAALIEALLAYIQYFFLGQGNLIGYDQTSNQPYGIFQNINTMSTFLASGLVLSGYLLSRQQRKYGEKISRTTLLYLAPLILTPVIILLASRTSWLITLLSVTLLLPYLFKFSTRKRFLGWIGSLLAGVAIGLIIAFSSGNSSYVAGEVELESARKTVLPQVADMFIEKPFTGYGQGRFESEYILYSARQHQLNPDYPAAVENIQHPFNEVLYWGIEGGLLPVLGISLAAFLVLMRISSTRKGTRLAILALLMPIALHAQIENPFNLSAIHWVTFVILLYWVDQRTAKYKRYATHKYINSGIKIFTLLLPLTLCSYMALTLQASYQLTQFTKSYPKQEKLLEEIIAPLSFQNQVEWLKHSSHFRSGLVAQDLATTQEFILWARQAIKQQPTRLLYRNLILAYFATGEVSKAEQIRDEAGYLFPGSDFSMLYLEPIVKAEKQN